MYEKFVSDLGKIKEQPKVSVSIYDNPSINPEYCRQQLDSIDTISDEELYNLIKAAYKTILKDILDRNDPQYIDAFIKPKFLSMFIRVLSSVPLEYEERICCNKLSYDYFTLKNNDPYTKQLFMTLAKITNRDKIPSLTSIGLPEDLSTRLVLSRYSSTKEIINVKRTNFIITTSPKDLMTLQMIVYIYERLFLESFTPLFKGTMFDVYDDEEEWIDNNEDIMEVYSTVSLAVLTILNNMPSENIRRVLIPYTSDFEILYGRNKNTCRFSLRALSEDFIRITNVVDALEAENIYVP